MVSLLIVIVAICAADLLFLHDGKATKAELFKLESALRSEIANLKAKLK